MIFKRTLASDASNVKRGEFYSLIVERDPDHGLTTIRDAKVTSHRHNAEVLEDEAEPVALTPDEVRWLHAQLGELVQVLDAETAAAPDTNGCGS